MEKALDNATPRNPFRPSDWLTRPVYADDLAQHADEKAPPVPGSHLRAVIGRYIRLKDGDLPKDQENRLMAWSRHPVAAQPFDAVSAEDLQRHIDARLRAGISANTIRNDVFALSGVYTHATDAPRAGGRGGWGMNVVNPCSLVELPLPGDARERRLWPGEEERLRKALAEGPDGAQMVALFSLLLETGMRLGEAMAVLPGWHVRAASGTSYISIPSKNTKTRRKRNVVLSPTGSDALASIVAGRPEAEADAPFFALNRPAVEYRWKLARAAAMVTDLHLHDLRHEALSRMAEIGLTIAELQNQSGHASARILMRYIHANPDRIAAKMSAA